MRIGSNVKREPGKESSTIRLSPLIPDLRSRKAAEVELAIGQITAMNESMRRRRCYTSTVRDNSSPPWR